MAEPARLKSTTATVSLASGFAHNSRPTGHVAIRPPAYLLAHAGNKRIKKRRRAASTTVSSFARSGTAIEYVRMLGAVILVYSQHVWIADERDQTLLHPPLAWVVA
jgi:hypothetical protein